MKLAVHFPDYTLPGGSASIPSVLAATAKVADEGGVDTFTLMDHWLQLESQAPVTDPMLEGYTTLGFLAGQTERISLGLLVTGITYRPPGFLSKIVATLDVLSGGRAMLGLGSGWYEREHRALGVPFPPLTERYTRFEESIRVLKQMFSDNDGGFQGRHYQLAETICSPKPIQPGGPPLLIGGGGEVKTLALVAKYADATSMFDLGIEDVSNKLHLVREHCTTFGRDYSRIEKTLITGADPLDDVDGFLQLMEDYSALGISKVWVNAPAKASEKWMTKVVKKVLPRLTDV